MRRYLYRCRKCLAPEREEPRKFSDRDRPILCGCGSVLTRVKDAPAAVARRPPYTGPALQARGVKTAPRQVTLLDLGNSTGTVLSNVTFGVMGHEGPTQVTAVDVTGATDLTIKGGAFNDLHVGVRAPTPETRITAEGVRVRNVGTVIDRSPSEEPSEE